LAVQQCIEDWDLPFERSCTRGRQPNTVVAMFSKPSNRNPVPGAVVSIHFQLKQVKNEKKRGGRQAKSKSFIVEGYRIENELHAYKPEEGIPTRARLDAIIDTKARMKNLFDLRNPSDISRLLDPANEESKEIEFTESKEFREEAEAAAAENHTDKETIIDLEKYLIELFQNADKSGDGKLDHHELHELLTDTKLGLSADDAYLVLATAGGNQDGLIGYKEFVPIAMELIATLQAREAGEDQFANIKEKIARQQKLLMQRAEVSPVEMMHGIDKQALEDQLMQLFMKHDVDQNGVLDEAEFRTCLKATSLGLEDSDIDAIVLATDENQDTQVEWTEFMKIAYTVLVFLAREKTLQTLMDQ